DLGSVLAPPSIGDDASAPIAPVFSFRDVVGPEAGTPAVPLVSKIRARAGHASPPGTTAAPVVSEQLARASSRPPPRRSRAPYVVGAMAIAAAAAIWLVHDPKTTRSGETAEIGGADPNSAPTETTEATPTATQAMNEPSIDDPVPA